MFTKQYILFNIGRVTQRRSRSHPRPWLEQLLHAYWYARNKQQNKLLTTHLVTRFQAFPRIAVMKEEILTLCTFWSVSIDVIKHFSSSFKIKENPHLLISLELRSKSPMTYSPLPHLNQLRKLLQFHWCFTSCCCHGIFDKSSTKGRGMVIH